MNSFKNKTAFITGGASGIGLGMAKAFAELGMKLALADIDTGRLASVVQDFEDAGVPVLALPLDVTDGEAVQRAVAQAAEAFGSINLVCANAGVSGSMSPLDEVKVPDWDWVIDVNLKGSVYTIQACVPYLLANPEDAHIVITSSISGLRVYEPSRGQGMYNTTKYALVGLGEALRIDLGRYGIGVSILCPGVVNTDISNSGRNRPERYGGAYSINEDHELAKAAGTGTDPRLFGKWVVKAIEQDLLYVVTHPGDREQVEERHRKIMEAFDYSKKLTG